MLTPPVDNRFLYNIYDFMMKSLQPYNECCQYWATGYRRIAEMIDLPVSIPGFTPEINLATHEWMAQWASSYRRLAGYCHVAAMLTNIYDKPAFDINEIPCGDDYVEITKVILSRKSFGKLVHFKRMDSGSKRLSKLLLVAPMSGHHATLLRDTVRNLLPFYDVYITDWEDARNVPLKKGSFDLDEFIEYIISWLRFLGPDVHVMAVCQPTVPVLVALAIMSSENDSRLPASAILLGGPIDTSESPTAVNRLATSRGDNWFVQNVISMVPAHYPGAMRLVYPGFLQLAGFLGMNLQRHIESLGEAIENFAVNRQEEAFKTLRFYLEYFSVMDLTAEFYMQTINTVFQERLLTTGRFKTRGRVVRLQDIKNTAILAIEGGRDDITGVGQTKSVLKLCRNLPDHMKRYFLAEEVGHYGLFNGGKFNKIIIPEIRAFTETHTRQLTDKKEPV